MWRNQNIPHPLDIQVKVPIQILSGKIHLMKSERWEVDSEKWHKYSWSRPLPMSTAAAVGGSTNLSAGVETLFAPAVQSALSPFPALKGSQMSFPPYEPVLRSLGPACGKKQNVKKMSHFIINGRN